MGRVWCVFGDAVAGRRWLNWGWDWERRREPERRGRSMLGALNRGVEVEKSRRGILYWSAVKV